ncbi:amiloride-sensitive sodium channel subunit alpha-like [Galendromus occidentalis]|uniref:Amiloride-sensitive sodium channel subunit alpha-like n=1 Tax=Galendromus occidentalis TaxID=34638 RepID=A0AAJ7L699_9ACAR|nr:amiloride-sensitive sodium channel subunit alpha-like [Galendromus occidentalis]
MKRFLNLLIYAACFSGLIMQVSNLVATYLERRTQVSQTEVPKRDLQFPAVTICVDFWTSKAKLCEIHRNNCSKRSMSIMTVMYLQNINAELRNVSAFDPEDLFSCRLKGTGSCGIDVNCADAIRMTSFRRPLQMCYTLDLTRKPQYACDEPWSLEVSLGTAVKPRDTIIFMRSQSVPVILVEAGIAPLLEIPSVSLRPGYSHEVAIRQQKIKRLPAPFESDCVEYEPMGYQADMNGRHSMESCVQQCLYQQEFALCGCITYTHEFVGSIGLPVCLNATRGFEYCKQLIIGGPGYRACYAKCRVPCREIRYDVKLARIAPIPDIEAAEKETNFRVKFRFSTFNVEVLEVSPLINFQTLMAYMGATFGVWIGLSLIDILSWLARRGLPIPFSISLIKGGIFIPDEQHPILPKAAP